MGTQNVRLQRLKEIICEQAAIKQATKDKKITTKDGVLTEEVASSSLSTLGCSAYLRLSVPRHNLSDVSILCKYALLQILELPYNKIKDLSCVSHMPDLVILDVSHNELSDVGFQPPKSLKELNFSHNRMTKMKDLSAFSSLCKLELDYNSFKEISGLEQCYSLTHLSLAHNKISKIGGLDNLPLKDLCLRGNQLARIEALETLRNLRVLDLSLNRIISLSGLQNLRLLVSINLKNNLISEIKETTHIYELTLLRELNLQRNPVQEQPDYRLSIIFLLQHLTRLDQEKVTAEEKVASVNKYDPPLEVVAARNHMTNLVYQLMQPQVLYDSTLPNVDTPYPMLVLTGPQACGKRELAHKLCQEFGEYFGYGACHTTRGPYYGEEDGSDYHFVSEEDFQNMIHMGKFIQTMQYGGQRYGLTRDAIEDVAKEGLACCVHMELEGVLSLMNSHFEPRYVLLIPTQVEQYTSHLRSRDLYTPAQIDYAVARIELYANTNRRRPGFFDNVIPCDDQAEAYQTLTEVVKEYLGLEKEGEASPDPTSTVSGPPPEERPTSAVSGSGTKSPTASALDPSDPSYRNYWTKVRAQLSPQKTPAELASIRRREQPVREGLVGRRPGIYGQVFNSSSEESRASSTLSLPSSAGAFSEVKARGQEQVGSGPTTDVPRPGTGQHSAVITPSSERPGSNAKPILPPIPFGRKTPAPPSPNPTV
ncbi:leucine-rich repeat and guanylate kinase domain-containing protein [Diretmus argenteus]